MFYFSLIAVGLVSPVCHVNGVVLQPPITYFLQHSARLGVAAMGGADTSGHTYLSIV